MNAEKLYLANKRSNRFFPSNPVRRVHQNPEIIQVLYVQPDDIGPNSDVRKTSVVSRRETNKIITGTLQVEECQDKIREPSRQNQPSTTPTSTVERASSGISGIKRSLPSYEYAMTEAKFKFANRIR